MEVAKYKVLDSLEHSGRQYQPGDEVELTEKEAKPLLAVGVIAASVSEPKKSAK